MKVCGTAAQTFGMTLWAQAKQMREIKQKEVIGEEALR
jgi:hypothetical protein